MRTMPTDPHTRMKAVIGHAFAVDDRWLWVWFAVWGAILVLLVWEEQVFEAGAVAGIIMGIVLGRASTTPPELADLTNKEEA